MSVSDACTWALCLLFVLSYFHVSVLLYYIVLLYYTTLYYLPLEACFLMREEKEIDPDGRGGKVELGVKRGKSIIRVYFVRKRNCSHKRETKKKK